MLVVAAMAAVAFAPPVSVSRRYAFNTDAPPYRPLLMSVGAGEANAQSQIDAGKNMKSPAGKANAGSSGSKANDSNPGETIEQLEARSAVRPTT